MSIFRSVPSDTVTRFDVCRPGTRWRFAVLGRGVPVGQTVRNVGAVAELPVRLNVTAVVEAGTRPLRSTLTVPAGPIGSGSHPLPVSRNWLSVRGLNLPGAPGA